MCSIPGYHCANCHVQSPDQLVSSSTTISAPSHLSAAYSRGRGYLLILGKKRRRTSLSRSVSSASCRAGTSGGFVTPVLSPGAWEAVTRFRRTRLLPRLRWVGTGAVSLRFRVFGVISACSTWTCSRGMRRMRSSNGPTYERILHPKRAQKNSTGGEASGSRTCAL